MVRIRILRKAQPPPGLPHPDRTDGQDEGPDREQQIPAKPHQPQPGQRDETGRDQLAPAAGRRQKVVADQAHDCTGCD